MMKSLLENVQKAAKSVKPMWRIELAEVKTVGHHLAAQAFMEKRDFFEEDFDPELLDTVADINFRVVAVMTDEKEADEIYTEMLDEYRYLRLVSPCGEVIKEDKEELAYQS